MKNVLIASLLVGGCFAVGISAQTPVPAGINSLGNIETPKTAQGKTAAAVPSPSYFATPLAFEANAGQTDKRVKFLARGQGYTLYLTNQDAVFALQSQRVDGKGRPTGPVESSSFRMSFVGANQAPQVSGTDLQKGYSNYLIGNDPKQWHTHVSNYSKVLYTDLYPGISALYYGNDRKLEVRPEGGARRSGRPDRVGIGWRDGSSPK